MSHSVSEAAARAVKNSERKKVLETRSPEEIIKGVRGNLAAHLAVTPSDTAFLLAQFDQERAAVLTLAEATGGLLKRAEAAEAQVADLQAKNDRFLEVYQQENCKTTVTFETGPVQSAAEPVIDGFGN